MSQCVRVCACACVTRVSVCVSQLHALEAEVSTVTPPDKHVHTDTCKTHIAIQKHWDCEEYV